MVKFKPSVKYSVLLVSPTDRNYSGWYPKISYNAEIVADDFSEIIKPLEERFPSHGFIVFTRLEGHLQGPTVGRSRWIFKKTAPGVWEEVPEQIIFDELVSYPRQETIRLGNSIYRVLKKGDVLMPDTYALIGKPSEESEKMCKACLLSLRTDLFCRPADSEAVYLSLQERQVA